VKRQAYYYGEVILNFLRMNDELSFSKSAESLDWLYVYVEEAWTVCLPSWQNRVVKPSLALDGNSMFSIIA
jgi:hypothetical protein